KEGKQKLPFVIQASDERPFAFAGLWEAWRGCEAGGGNSLDSRPPLESCTIITTTANELCRPVHERMPVILDPADYELWLDPAFQIVKLPREHIPPPAIDRFQCFHEQLAGASHAAVAPHQTLQRIANIDQIERLGRPRHNGVFQRQDAIFAAHG